MINLVDGVPGAGKTYYACRQIELALCAGKVVCTNVPLRPDWSWRVAGANPMRRLNPAARRRRAAELESRLLYSDDLEELFRVRTPGTAEGRAVMVLDEAHRWLNARSWAGTKGREQVVAWFTGHRHYGFDVFLITQYVDMVDKQVRNLVEYRTRLRNLKRERLLGVRVIPGNFFAAITELHGGKKETSIAGRDFYRLQRRIAGMYDTHGLAVADAPQDAIWLPRVAGAAPAAAGREGSPAVPGEAGPDHARNGRSANADGAAALMSRRLRVVPPSSTPPSPARPQRPTRP